MTFQFSLWCDVYLCFGDLDEKNIYDNKGDQINDHWYTAELELCVF